MDQKRRQLVVILKADVVGYSRLMADNESGTLRRLKYRDPKSLTPSVRS